MAENESTIDIPLTEQVLRSLDSKILEHPFYTGSNKPIWGISTPIKRNNTQDIHAPGLTPETVFLNDDKDEQKTPTSEDILKEIETEKAEKENRVKDITAEEMFEGTTIVLRGPDVISRRKDASRINWKSQQKYWAQKWELAGEYLGTGATLREIAKREGMAYENVDRMRLEVVKEISDYLGYRQPKKKESRNAESKPNTLWQYRDDLKDKKSDLFQVLESVEQGMKRAEIVKLIAGGTLHTYRQLLRSLDLAKSENLSNFLLERDPDHFKELEDPELGIERKRELLDNVITHSLSDEQKKYYNVKDLMSTLREAGLYLSTREVSVVTKFLEENDIYIKSVPIISRKQLLGYYRYHTTGDEEKIKSLVQNAEEFEYLRIPSVRVIGLPMDKLLTTHDIKVGVTKRSLVGIKKQYRRIEKAALDRNMTVEELVKDKDFSIILTRVGSKYIETAKSEEFSNFLNSLLAD